jgi:hypothetical protein
MMNILYQAVKALDPHTFENLVLHLLKARYRGIEIKYIEGASGDQGVDVISGRLDMEPATLRWFQKLGKSRAQSTEINVWQASDIVHQLLYEHTIRESFFPNTVLNTAELREIVTKTSELSTEELAILTIENMDSYFHRLQEYDARFTYGASFSRDREPTAASAPDELFTITTGQRTLHVYARDHEALRDRPPQGRFTLTGNGIEKFKQHLRTGIPQTLTSEEVVGFTSDFDFLLPPIQEQTRLTLSLTTRGPNQTIPLRVTFGEGESAVTYEYILFQATHTGTEETTLESTGTLPFSIILVLRKDGTGAISFRDTSAGSEVHEIQRFLRAMSIGLKVGTVEFYDLAKAQKFLVSTLRGSLPAWIDHYTSVIDDAVITADAYHVTLTRPLLITPGDGENLAILKQLAVGVRMHVDEISLALDKVLATAASLRAALSEECSYRIIASGDNVLVFGTNVPTGAIEYVIGRARIKNVSDLLEYLDNAPLGTRADIVLAPIGPIFARRHTDPDAKPVLQFQPLAPE